MRIESHLYPGYVLRGPYINIQQRQYLTGTCKSGHRICVMYNRFVMETFLDRRLMAEETVDHIDRNTLNDDITNLQILPFGAHKSLDVFRNKAQTFICQVCQKEFTLTGRPLSKAKQNQKHGCKGPFCSHLCANRAANHIKNYCAVAIPIEKYSMKDEEKENVANPGG